MIAWSSPQDALIDRLSGVPLFATLAADQREMLLREAEVLRLPKGGEVEGVGRETLLVLLSGAMAMGVAESGGKTVFMTVDHPAALNLSCVMTAERCEIFWRALESVELLLVPGAAFRGVLAKDAAFAAAAYGELAGVFQRLLARAAGQRLQSANRRVAGYILSLIESGTGGAVARFPCEKHVVASLLGMTPENLSRSLGRLTQCGVSISGSSIRVESVDRLKDAVAAL